VHPGFGSDQGFLACSSWGETKEDICRALLNYTKNHATKDELLVLCMYKIEHNNGTAELRFRDNDRLVEIHDMEHWECLLYQVLVWTLSNRATNVAQPAQPHCHPSSIDIAKGTVKFDIGADNIAREAFEAFRRMVEDGTWKSVSEKFCLRNEEEIREALDEIVSGGFSSIARADSANSDEPIRQYKKQKVAFAEV